MFYHNLFIGGLDHYFFSEDLELIAKLGVFGAYQLSDIDWLFEYNILDNPDTDYTKSII